MLDGLEELQSKCTKDITHQRYRMLQIAKSLRWENRQLSCGITKFYNDWHCLTLEWNFNDYWSTNEWILLSQPNYYLASILKFNESQIFLMRSAPKIIRLLLSRDCQQIFHKKAYQFLDSVIAYCVVLKSISYYIVSFISNVSDSKKKLRSINVYALS